MKVYLSQLRYGNYDITCIGLTEKEAVDNVYKSYKEASKARHQDPLPKNRVFDYYGGFVLPMNTKEVRWL